LEARLSAALGSGGGATSPLGADSPKTEIPDEAAVETGANGWPDEAAETAFRAEAIDRGEPDVLAATATEATEETDTKGLPALEDLVKRIPPEARELLDELFRAKFTGVKRVPAKALKS
jgi:hypothetical protein